MTGGRVDQINVPDAFRNHERRIRALEAIPFGNASSIYMPRIVLSFSGNFPQHFNPVAFDTETGSHDLAVYDFVSGNNEALRFIQPGIFLVQGLLQWNYDWDFADWELDAGVAGSGVGGIFTGSGTRTQTGVREGLAGETNFKEQWGIYVVTAATDGSNYVSVKAGVRNESGAIRSSVMFLRAMRLSSNAANVQ
jgi:hypothetical protein